MSASSPGGVRVGGRAELLVAGFALVALVAAQLSLSRAIHGTNYDGGDGKMTQAIILAGLRFGQPFHLNTLSPIQGVGGQLLPLNVWVNPAYWPFAVLDRDLATDVSAALALAVFAVAVYIMARCFDVPVVPSAIAAQLCIALFAPVLFLLKLSTVFSIMTGNAVVYAPQMVALGLLARVEPGSARAVVLATAGIFALVLYSVACDPLWATVTGVGWAVPFGVVAIGSLRRRTLLLRCAVLASVVVLLLVSRTAEYLYTLSRYTARVEFSRVVDRPRGLDLAVSTLFYSPYVKYLYGAWLAGWLLGLATLRGRARLLAVAALAASGALLVYGLAYVLLLGVAWRVPLPVYLEQGLMPLFGVAAVAGVWGGLRALLAPARRLAAAVRTRGPWVVTAASVLAVAALPAAVADYAKRHAPAVADSWWERWPDEPELGGFFAERIGVAAGRPFRGSVHFNPVRDYATGLTVSSQWARGVPTVREYSQLVTPQALYFQHAVLGIDVTGMLNGFNPHLKPDDPHEMYWKALQLFGARYFVAGHRRSPAAEAAGLPWTVFPRRPLYGASGVWYVYELPAPNTGDYSPTEVIVAASGPGMAAALRRTDVDFRRQAVLATAVHEVLVPARDLRLSRIRGGLHVAGHSDGTSLLVLPQQFSHCLRPRDARVRLLRADLMLTGVLFSGRLDTDIVFDLGMFAPGCRWADIAETKALDLRIDLRQKHLQDPRIFPDWPGLVTRLRAAAAALQ
jgi:hypothetical protein